MSRRRSKSLVTSAATIFDGDANARSCAVETELNFFDASAFDDTRALAGGVFQQQLIESAAIDMVSIILSDAEFGNFAEANDMFPGIGPVGPDCAVFVDKFFLLHRGKEINFLEDARGGADEGFAYVRSRMDGLIEDDVIDVGF